MDSGTIGLVLAAGFTVLGIVVAPLFVLGAVPLGVAVAVVLRYTAKNR